MLNGRLVYGKVISAIVLLTKKYSMGIKGGEWFWMFENTFKQTFEYVCKNSKKIDTY